VKKSFTQNRSERKEKKVIQVKHTAKSHRQPMMSVGQMSGFIYGDN
jgi:hypothetical protein